MKLIYKLGLDKNRRIPWKNCHFWPKGNYFVMPIIVASDKGHIEVVKFFANIPGELKKSVCPKGTSLIFRAISLKNLDILKLLLEFEPNVNVQLPKCGKSLIHYALQDFEIFEYLMSLPGINPNLIDNDQKTALQKLCDEKNQSENTENFSPLLDPNML